MSIYLPVANIAISVVNLIALGAVSGFLSGLYGIGGGIISVPTMIFFGIPSNIVVGTASFQLLGTSVAGTMRNIAKSTVDVRVSTIMVLGGLIGSTVGSVAMAWLEKLGVEERATSIAFVLVIVAVLVPMLAEISKSAYATNTLSGRGHRNLEMVKKYKLRQEAKSKFRLYSKTLQVEYNVFWISLIGAVVGAISSIIGIGGGIISIPIMMYTTGMSFRSASATSMLQILLTSLSNLVWQVRAENVDLVLGIALLTSSTATAQLGAIVQSKSKLTFLRITFALLLTLILAVFIFRLVGGLGGDKK